MPSEEEMAGPSGSGAVSHDAASGDCRQASGTPAIAELIDQIQAMLTADTGRLLASLNDMDDIGVSQEADSGRLAFHASLSYVSGHRAWHLDIFWQSPLAQAAPASRRATIQRERAASIALAWTGRQAPDNG